MNFKTTVKAIGSQAQRFIALDKMIIFGEPAPMALSAVSITVDKVELQNDVSVGDTISFAGKDYKVTAVGEAANKTLKEDCHCTFSFSENGGVEPQMDGYIELSGGKAPILEIGDVIEFK